MKTDDNFHYSGAWDAIEFRNEEGPVPAPSPNRLPLEMRPRERLLREGHQSLSDKELLSVMLNTGIKGKCVTALASELLDRLDSTDSVPTVQELCEMSGMGETKAAAVTAMLEFGRRRWGVRGQRARNPGVLYSLIRHYADRRQERLLSISLNGAHEVLNVRVVTIGLVNRTVVHPREVFADVILDRASAVVVAHNHPAGSVHPSKEDDSITDRLRRASRVLGLHFLDHIVFTENEYFSYRQTGRLND